MSRRIPRWAAALVVVTLLAVAGVIASLATSSSGHHGARFGRHLVAVSHTREVGNETIELIKHQDQLVGKAAAPFDRVAPGAYADAVDKRNKAPKTTSARGRRSGRRRSTPTRPTTRAPTRFSAPG